MGPSAFIQVEDTQVIPVNGAMFRDGEKVSVAVVVENAGSSNTIGMKWDAAVGVYPTPTGDNSAITDRDTDAAYKAFRNSIDFTSLDNINLPPNRPKYAERV